MRILTSLERAAGELERLAIQPLPYFGVSDERDKAVARHGERADRAEGSLGERAG